MKIAILGNYPTHIIPDFGDIPPPTGHCATWFPPLIEAFSSKTDFEFHWLRMSDAISEPRYAFWNRQHFHLLPTSSSGRALSLFRRDRVAIRTRLDAIDPDLVHGWGSEDVYGMAAVFSGRRHLLSIQGILSHYILRNRMANRDYFQAALEMALLWKAKEVTAESRWAIDLLCRRAPHLRPHHVEYGVQRAYFDLTWNPDPAQPAALFVGTLDKRKGLQDLIPVFASPRLAHAQLWIAGSGGGWSEQLQAVSTPNVHWLGRLEPQEVAHRMEKAWCLAIPTRADTGPTVMKEARVVGLPLVSTPCGGQTGYIEHGKNGFLLPPGDLPGLTTAFEELFGSYDRCREMGAWLHAEQREGLRPQWTAEAFCTLYRQLASS